VADVVSFGRRVAVADENDGGVQGVQDHPLQDDGASARDEAHDDNDDYDEGLPAFGVLWRVASRTLGTAISARRFTMMPVFAFALQALPVVTRWATGLSAMGETPTQNVVCVGMLFAWQGALSLFLFNMVAGTSYRRRAAALEVCSSAVRSLLLSLAAVVVTVALLVVKNEWPIDERE
jgi:hypothetical protein